MGFGKFIFLVALFFGLAGCASKDCKPVLGAALQGTDTALVGLFLDDKKYPQASLDQVTVHPGQRIIFAGPSRFDILFKDQRSPIEKLEIQSINGVVVIDIPKDIFERERRRLKTSDSNDAKELIYNYGIRVNGRVTDPSIRITPQ